MARCFWVEMLIFVILMVKASDNPSAYMSCSLDGCNSKRTGLNPFLGLPASSPKLLWNYSHPYSTLTSTSYLGCSSNGNMIVCAFPTKDGVVSLFGGNGSVAWSSSRVDGTNALFNGGAPVISDQGFVGVNDGNYLYYFTNEGEILWWEMVSTYGLGAKYSMSATDNGYLPIRLGSGYFALYEVITGMCWASMPLGYSDFEFFYGPTGTSAVLQNRAYIPTAWEENHDPNNDVITFEDEEDHPARLYAVDCSPDMGDRLKVRWYWEHPFALIGEGSTVIEDETGRPVVFFYGLDALNVTYLYAIRDMWPESDPELLWNISLLPSTLGLLQDSRLPLSIWLFNGTQLTNNNSDLLIRMNVKDGSLLQKISLKSLGLSTPTSRGIINPLNTSKTQVNIMVAAFESCVDLSKESSSHSNPLPCIAAIDVIKEIIVWKYYLPTIDDIVQGQLLTIDPDLLGYGGVLAFFTTKQQVIAIA